MGLVLGSVVLDEKSAAIAVPITLSPFILFSGFFKNRADMAPWYRWI
jgi:ATP-binding cassette subfamily G (WHITE) protein 2